MISSKMELTYIKMGKDMKAISMVTKQKGEDAFITRMEISLRDFTMTIKNKREN